MKDQPYIMRNWDEILGSAISVEEVDGQCIALIGKILVHLPIEMAPQLLALKDQKIGILRTDRDYRVRICDPRQC